MKRVATGLVMAGWLLAAAPPEPMLQRFEFSQTEMATPIRIVLYATDNATAAKAAKEAFSRFHQLNAILSDYDPQSELRRLCDTSGGGKAVKLCVSPNCWSTRWTLTSGGSSRCGKSIQPICRRRPSRAEMSLQVCAA